MRFALASFLLLCKVILISTDSDNHSKIVKYLQKFGYSLERHEIQTQDGYILTVQKILHERQSNQSKNVALLVHGLGGSGENFIFAGPQRSLAFLLADRGYDVWLFQARGTPLSRKHRTLHPTKDRKKFWNFSWHELGVYDLKDTIDYVLNTTGSDGLFLVGHSQGGTIFFVMMSEFPELNEKIRAAGMLAPGVFTGYTQASLLLLAAKLYPLLERVAHFIGFYELPIPNSQTLPKLLQALCTGDMLKICIDIAFAFMGPYNDLWPNDQFPFMLQYFPAGCSLKQVGHYAQIITAKKFVKYNHGPQKNMKLYNSTEPPEYNLGNVKMPIAIFFGMQDPFANTKMMEILKSNLPNVVSYNKMPIEEWNHLDFLWNKDLAKLVNEPLLEIFKKYES
ncbi:hypothetical protein ABEB36_006495 [Hypothenemus hampei]|uniref:Lipase n=1 Tax=Hypothenemus hampei TaxID=57062 RepID=A0ABD1EQP9_HYPHA